ncbi:MAG: 30S ribosomal protein S13 [Deltaproteobacteria bacterium]|nr:30S ribosomal protein S13 [Deltaproteobacteria bacterium]
MARIVGVELPKNKRMEIALTYVYGIGKFRAREILKKTGISPDKHTDDLKDDEITKLGKIIREYRVEGDLRRDTSTNIKRLIDIGSYRGLRHRKGLPVRGQRTRTNARVRKGKKKTIGKG